MFYLYELSAITVMLTEDHSRNRYTKLSSTAPCMEGLSVSVRCFGGNWIRHRADRSPISRGYIHT